ncbi:MAG TPA: cytochrome c biogenesis protein CcdA [Jiangellaceae bacterium]|nr:cytochrome c biogenesis protein CcdA [Jiangellaceae bacterium]
MTDTLLLAATAGMVAAFNPCGFALLPAYLSLLVGRGGAGSPVGRALAAAAAMTAGFAAVFGAFGLVVVPLALSLGRYLSWATVVVGVALVLLGVWLLTGRELVVRLPRLRGAAPIGGTASMVIYGIAYAVASLSCTIAPFLAVTTSTFRAQSTAAGIAVFVAYALGMGVVVGVLAVAVALAQDGLLRRLRGVMPYVSRLSGALLVLAGVYVTYYGVYELRLANGNITDDPVISTATSVRGAVARFVDGLGPWVLLGVLAVLVGAGIAMTKVLRTRSRR